MQYIITGDNMQALQMNLQQNEQVYAEAGSMLYYRGAINMDSKAHGGLIKSFSRKIFTGESLFMTTFTCQGETGEVAFASPTPGKIKNIELKGSEILCSKDSYLCSIGNVNIDITFTKKITAGMFGGQGFILQKISGEGLVFIHGGGNFVELDLLPQEKILVDTGCIVMFEPTVSYDVNYVGGIKKALFGGEGLFLASLVGPGKVILQTLPFSRLASQLGDQYVTSGGPSSNVLGGIFGR
jgi:uncharacterized protein (TIGR00266 family)